MTSQVAERGSRVMVLVGGGSVGLALALIVAAIIWSWPLMVVGGGLQLLGIGLTLLGVAVVHSWLEKAAEQAVERKQGLERWLVLRREQLRRWWARRRGRPVIVHVAAADFAAASDFAGVGEVQRQRVDPATVSDREWLEHLDSQIEGIYGRLSYDERNRNEERKKLDEGLAAQRDELRAAIFRETRQGWELIVAGLACSAIGTALGMAA